MALPNNLHKRNSTYYARVYIPKDVQHHFEGKKEKWLSLGTKDLREAKVALAEVMAEWTRNFELASRAADLSGEETSNLIRNFYSSKIQQGDAERTAPTEQEVQAATNTALTLPHNGMFSRINNMSVPQILANRVEWAARRRNNRIAQLQAELGKLCAPSLEKTVDQLLAENGLTLPKTGPEYRDLCLNLARAELSAARITNARAAGDFEDHISDPLISRILTEPAASPALPTESLMEVFELYESDNPTSVRTETMKQIRRDVQLFSEFIGPNMPLENITKRVIGDYKDLLLTYPVQAAQTQEFKGLSIREVIEANKSVGKPPIVRRTVNRYLSSLSGFFNWLEARGRVGTNPVNGLITKPKGKEAEQGRAKTLTSDHISTLLSSPLFTSCRDDTWAGARKPGTHKIRDHRYWIPLTMMYSGARPAEIAQLYCDDIYRVDDIWVMAITDEEQNQRVKRDNSRRLVPIHHKLIDLGILDHLSAAQNRGDRQLFSEVVLPETGQIAAQHSREFNRYLTFLGIKQDRSIRAYSLRHGFIDRAREGGFMDHEIALIVGHDKSLMLPKRVQTSGYGRAAQGTLELRRTIVESVTYNGIT